MSTFEAPSYVPPSNREVEHSWRHRLAVLANTIASFGAYFMVDPDAAAAWPVVITVLGSAFSHWRRRGNNLAVKWLLALGMLYALWSSLSNLLRGQFDPRLSLAQLLLALQVLNSFDLPRRRNLRVALLVAAILMMVSGSLSRTTDFGYFTFAFAVTMIWALYEGYVSESGAASPSWQRVVGVTTATLVAMAVFSLPFFILAPRKARTLTGMTLPLSLAIPLPDALDSHVRSPGEKIQGQATDLKSQRAYGGFSERLDLDVRMTPTDEVVLRVKSDRMSYWRAMAFDVYDGRGWKMSHAEDVTPMTDTTPPFRLALPTGQHGGAKVVQTFFVERDGGNLIFAAWAPREVYFPTALIWHDAYGGLRSPVMLQKDMYYSVVSEPPLINRAVLALQRARPLPESVKPYLALPATSQRVKALAAKVAGKEKTPYGAMAALEGYLSTSYPYRRDVAAAPPNAEWVDHFLFEQRAGFCEQFATSLAVMGRLRGVPTRLVTGYAPGDYNPFTGYYDVRARDAHAWVEAWIPNQGWVPFDATPGSMVQADEGEDDRGREVVHALWGYVAPLFTGRPWAVALVGLLLVGALAGLARLVRGVRPPARPSTAAYRRMRKRLEKRGVAALAEQTPQDWLQAARAVPAIEPALETLTDFVTRYEAVRFGGEAAAESQQAKELVSLARQVERELAGRR